MPIRIAFIYYRDAQIIMGSADIYRARPLYCQGGVGMSLVKGRSESSDNERRTHERLARFVARIKQKSTRVSLWRTAGRMTDRISPAAGPYQRYARVNRSRHYLHTAQRRQPNWDGAAEGGSRPAATVCLACPLKFPTDRAA
jgi:hypothetical protein